MAEETKSSLSPAIVVVGIVALVIIAIALFFAFGKSQQSVTSSQETGEEITASQETRTPTGSFEFRGPGYVEVSDPREASIIIVNAPGAQAARPIDVTLKVDGKEVWKETIKAGESNCGDANTCSITAPSKQTWEGIREGQYGPTLEATDAAGNLLALFANLGASEGF